MTFDRLLPWIALGLAALAALGVLAAVAAVLWVRFWRRRLSPDGGFDEVIETRTRDGATVVLTRIRPRGEPSSRPPVVLCHGLAMNRHALALDPERSLARALAARGRDCWLVELRGASPTGVRGAARAATFDTYLEHDVPTALATVRAAAECDEVDWVGFSMGGMLAYAHLGAMQGGGVRRLVTIGSPVRFAGYPATRAMVAAPYVFTPFGMNVTTPLGWLATGAAPLAGPWLPVKLTRGLRPHHYDAVALRRVLGAAFSDVPAGVMKSFARWVHDDSFASADGRVDYRAGIARITVPLLVIAGDRDRLALPPCVKEAHTLARSAEKRFLEVGTATGAHAHYDHLDLILGARSPDEVFPHVIDWLERD